LDWHHPSYLHDWDGYVRYYHGQVEELCTKYGEIGGMLFDGFWPNTDAIDYTRPDMRHFIPGGEWEFGKLYDLIHTHQPDAMITNNLHIPPLDGEDYYTSESDMPGENNAGWNVPVETDKPMMGWLTMNDSWCYQAHDRRFKTPGYLTRALMTMAGKNQVFFLNVGPDGSGRIRDEEKERFRYLAEWQKTNGEAIYGVRPIKSYPWGFAVQKDGAVYVYVLHYPGGNISIECPTPCETAVILGGETLEMMVNGGMATINLPKKAFNPVGYIIKIS
jgi:alpha-L-fucosidase